MIGFQETIERSRRNGSNFKQIHANVVQKMHE